MENLCLYNIFVKKLHTTECRVHCVPICRCFYFTASIVRLYSRGGMPLYFLKILLNWDLSG